MVKTKSVSKSYGDYIKHNKQLGYFVVKPLQELKMPNTSLYKGQLVDELARVKELVSDLDQVKIIIKDDIATLHIDSTLTKDTLSIAVNLFGQDKVINND